MRTAMRAALYGHLALALALGAFPPRDAAAVATTLVVADAAGGPGTPGIAVAVRTTDALRVGSTDVTLVFPRNVLAAVSASSAVLGSFTANIDNATGRVRTASAAAAGNDVPANGALFTVVFDVRPDAAFGCYQLGIEDGDGVPPDDLAGPVPPFPAPRILYDVTPGRFCVSTCGDGEVQAGEDCDPGADRAGDCCAADCVREPASTSCDADADRCTRDACDAAGACARVDTVPCAPGTGCRDAETCDPATGLCTGGGPKPLDTPCNTDADLCTVDRCDGLGSCVFRETVTCAGATACRGAESCNPVNGQCSAGDPKPSGTACDADADPCTVDECDGLGGCAVVGPVPQRCGDACLSSPPEECDPALADPGCQPEQICGAPASLDPCLCIEPPVLDHYVLYKAKGSPIEALPDRNRFPKAWNVTLDDVQLPNDPPGHFPADPENYTVAKELGIAFPAMKNAEPTVGDDVRYLRYQVKGAAEGIGALLPTGKFPKAVTAPKRQWEMRNQLGTLVVETKKATAVWVPAGAAPAPTVPGDPGDRTHFVCYDARAAKIPSDQAPDDGKGKGVFRKDLQAYFLDSLGDCRFFEDGQTVAFAGSPVEGRCLLDLTRPKEVCSPADKSPVEPPRSTAAVIRGSTATLTGETLLCYQAKLGTRVRSAAAAALGRVEVDDELRQRKHAKRRLQDGTQLNTVPGNLFPRPVAVDTNKVELVCVPTTVLAVSDL